MRDALIHWLQLAYFMAPAYCANMAPPLVKYWRGWNRPIHVRWLGAHKTVIGFAFGVAVGLLAAAVQTWIHAPFSLVDDRHWIALGFGFGGGAMLGDTIKSFVKRRLGIAAGSKWIPFDQLDFAIGALTLVWPSAHLTISDILAILLMTFISDILVNQVSFRCGIKDRPW